jgi:hypothetical protein
MENITLATLVLVSLATLFTVLVAVLYSWTMQRPALQALGIALDSELAREATALAQLHVLTTMPLATAFVCQIQPMPGYVATVVRDIHGYRVRVERASSLARMQLHLASALSSAYQSLRAWRTLAPWPMTPR